jgi:hypothetical protein
VASIRTRYLGKQLTTTQQDMCVVASTRRADETRCQNHMSKERCSVPLLYSPVHSSSIEFDHCVSVPLSMPGGSSSHTLDVSNPGRSLSSSIWDLDEHPLRDPSLKNPSTNPTSMWPPTSRSLFNAVASPPWTCSVTAIGSGDLDPPLQPILAAYITLRPVLSSRTWSP